MSVCRCVGAAAAELALDDVDEEQMGKKRALKRLVLLLRQAFAAGVRACESVCARACVCACVCARTHSRMRVCVCACEEY